MTQLVGAICEGGNVVVVLSDRLVSRAGLTFERGSKGEKIADNAMVLTAGTVHEPELIHQTKADLNHISNPPLLTIAEILADKYQQIRLARAEDLYVRPRGFAGIDDFYAKQRMLHDSLVIEISDAIERHGLGVHILLGGVDQKAHLYCIRDPGIYSSFDSIGFYCPGMGKEQAESTFVWYDFDPDLSVRETLYIAFEAKKKAETAGQVGGKTDAWIIDRRGIHEVHEDTIEELKAIYSARQSHSRFGPDVPKLTIPT